MEATDIVVRDKLAGLCRTGCPNYGKSLSCPPHVAGPEEMRRLAAAGRFALVVKLDATRDEMLTAKRREVMQRLHRLVAGVERARAGAGLRPEPAPLPAAGARTCSALTQKDCRVLAGRGECRNPGPGQALHVRLRRGREPAWPGAPAGDRRPSGRSHGARARALLPAYGLILLGRGPAGEDQ